MRIFICVIVILAILICAFVFNYFFLKYQSDIILQNLNTLEKYAYEEDFVKCNTSYRVLEENWENCKDVLFIFSNHKELDEIYKSMLRIKSRIEYEDYGLLIEEIRIAKQMISDVPHKEKPTIENIF